MRLQEIEELKPHNKLANGGTLDWLLKHNFETFFKGNFKNSILECSSRVVEERNSGLFLRG